LFSPFLLLAQARFQDEKTGKWGYRDAEWNIIVPAIYDEVQPNFDTIMAVKKDGKMAAFDNNGKIRIPLIYEQIMPNLSPFRSQYGYAAVTKNNAQRNTWGMVDARGKVILPEKFQYVRAITPTLLVGRIDGDSMLQFYNLKGALLYKIAGKKIEPLDIDNTCFGVDGLDHKTRYYKLDGTFVYPEDPNSGMWTDGKRTILWKDRKCGMINAKKETIIPFEFSSIRHGLPGQFIVEKRDAQYVDGGNGVYDNNGKVVIPLGNTGILPFGTVYRVSDHAADKNGIFSVEGKEILPVKYHFSSVFIAENSYGKKIPNSRPERYISALLQENHHQFLIRDDGAIIRPKGSQGVSYYAEDYPLIVEMEPANEKEAPKKMAIDFNGKVLLKADYQVLNFTSDPTVFVGNKATIGKIGFVKLSAPDETEFNYEYCIRLGNGHLVMRSGNRYDLYNSKLKMIHTGEYSSLYEPGKAQFEQFRAANLTTEKLVACAFRKDIAADEWVAVTASGATFIVKDPAQKPTDLPGTFVKRVDVLVKEGQMEEIDEAPPPPPPAPVDSANVVWQTYSIEKPAVYPGGQALMYKFIAQNLKYPRLAAENAIQGNVAVRFIVEKDGSLSDVKIIKDIGGGCGEEAKRLALAMPKWTPGQHNGVAVRMEYTLVVVFKLN
jgi:TonB family protein